MRKALFSYGKVMSYNKDYEKFIKSINTGKNAQQAYEIWRAIETAPLCVFANQVAIAFVKPKCDGALIAKYYTYSDFKGLILDIDKDYPCTLYEIYRVHTL